MDDVSGATSTLAEALRVALSTRDLDAFVALLSDDVQWGDGKDARTCRGRSDVRATMDRAMANGISGTITELATGTKGILCGFDLQVPREHAGAGRRSLYHVYLVRDGRIYEIKPFDTRRSATAAAGVA
ncbi:MAG TPA: nuclear transport factor 2 family protein [Acidimicrobiales bacterium]|nr:nuclear transport factor 2 family protein [Acidimicrobiales bacterium]